MCARFAKLGERLSGLVAIGKEPGGVAIGVRAIRDTIRQVGQMLDGLVRMCKH
jgi:hypothetical protein